MANQVVTNAIVCSFYTGDDYYKSHADRLKANLESLGIPYELREIAKKPGDDWADICRKKVGFIAEVPTAKENWRWSLAFELTNILSTCTQLGVVILFFAYLSWEFAVINILVVLAIFQVYGKLFSSQLDAQRGFVTARKNKEQITNAVRIGTRIKSGEIGILISGIAMLVLLGVLIYLSYIGGINTSNTIVLFFGLKMQNSNFSNVSTALMRFARARTNSE